MTMLGHDRLGVKLHPLNGQRLVSQSHDLAVISPRRYVQAARAGFAFDDE